MPNDDEPPKVAAQYLPQFKRNLKALAKKYRHIKTDIQPAIDAISGGDFIGDQIPDVGEKEPGVPYVVYKVRLANSDSQKGKRGGYRIIYEATTPLQVNFLVVYCKSDQGNVYSWEIREILKDFNPAPEPTVET